VYFKLQAAKKIVSNMLRFLYKWNSLVVAVQSDYGKRNNCMVKNTPANGCFTTNDLHMFSLFGNDEKKYCLKLARDWLMKNDDV